MLKADKPKPCNAPVRRCEFVQCARTATVTTSDNHHLCDVHTAWYDLITDGRAPTSLLKPAAKPKRPSRRSQTPSSKSRKR